MSDVLYGKKWVLQLYKSDGFYPIECVSEASLTVNTELLPSTSINSGSYRAFQPRLNDAEISVSGVWFLKGKAVSSWVALDLILEQVRQTGVDFRFTATDEGGFVRRVEGHAFIYTSTYSGAAGQLAKFNVSMKVSGPLKIDEAITVNPSDIMIYEGIHPGGTDFVQDAVLVGRTILWVDLSDSNIQVITTGTPDTRQVLYNASTGRLTWGREINPGEYYKIMYT